ncbi:hypothetical protein Ddc_22186 [Ditylenchus destructor]|nr:hypothetical protein Ddc_22186 [Ditylenchus destructor]
MNFGTTAKQLRSFEHWSLTKNGAGSGMESDEIAELANGTEDEGIGLPRGIMNRKQIANSRIWSLRVKSTTDR